MQYKIYQAQSSKTKRLNNSNVYVPQSAPSGIQTDGEVDEGEIYSAKQAAATATRATATRGEESAPAPFLLPFCAGAEVEDADDVDADAEEVMLDPEPLARTAAATSVGIMIALLARGEKSMAPL